MTENEEILYEMLTFDGSHITLGEFENILQEICFQKSFFLERVQTRSLPTPTNSMFMYTITNALPKLKGKPITSIVYEIEYLYSIKGRENNRILLSLSQDSILDIQTANKKQKEVLTKLGKECFNAVCGRFRVV